MSTFRGVVLGRCGFAHYATMAALRLQIILCFFLFLNAVDSTQWIASTLAGTLSPGYADGRGTSARFNDPSGIALAGSVSVVADTVNQVVRIIQAQSTVNTLAGMFGASGHADGVATTATFGYPRGVALDAAGSFTLVTDYFYCNVRRIDLGPGSVTTLAGTWWNSGFADGRGTLASFNKPNGIAMNGQGTIALVADFGNHAIRLIGVSTGEVSTLAGTAGRTGCADGTGLNSRFSGLRGIALNFEGTVAVAVDNCIIRRVDVSSRLVTTIAGRCNVCSSADGQGLDATFGIAGGIAVDAARNLVFVADTANNRVRLINTTSGFVSTIAGSGSSGHSDGQGTHATFNSPWGVSVDVSGSVHITEESNNLVRLLSALTTYSQTRSSSPSPSFSPSESPSSSFTPSQYPSPSLTPSESPSPSLTPSQSPSRSYSRSLSPTSTLTKSQKHTPLPTKSPFHPYVPPDLSEQESLSGGAIFGIILAVLVGAALIVVTCVS